MKKPFVLIAAIVAVVGFGAVFAVARETTEVENSVTLKYNPGSADPADDTFSGRVKARKAGCQQGRTVILRSDFAKASSDKTNARGRYEIFSSGPTSPPGYYAQVRMRKITKNNGDKIVCERNRSPNTVHVP